MTDILQPSSFGADHWTVSHFWVFNLTQANLASDHVTVANVTPICYLVNIFALFLFLERVFLGAVFLNQATLFILELTFQTRVII